MYVCKRDNHLPRKWYKTSFRLTNNVLTVFSSCVSLVGDELRAGGQAGSGIAPRRRFLAWTVARTQNGWETTDTMHPVVDMRTRQELSVDQPTNFAQGAGIVRGRDWSGEQFDKGSTVCADSTEGHSPNKTNGTMPNGAALNVNNEHIEVDMSLVASQEYSQDVRQLQRRRMMVTSPAKNAFLFAMISFLFLASMAPPASVPSASMAQGTPGSFFGLNRFAAYAEDADAGEDGEANDDFVDPLDGVDLDSVSVMPVSCLRYNNGHMIKFELFENSSNYQCHFNNLGTYVVSVAHYMRAHFNHQAMLKGRDFKL